MAERKRPHKKKPTKKAGSLKSIYARIRKEFSAADLQKYTEVEPLVPVEQVLAEMEAVQRKYEARQKRA